MKKAELSPTTVWVYATCPSCGYQNSFKKFDLQGEKSVAELKAFFGKQKCLSCGKSLKGGSVDCYNHQQGMVVTELKNHPIGGTKIIGLINTI